MLASLFEENILLEDNHLLVVNKLSGELTQGDQTKDITILDKAKQYLKQKYNKPGNVFIGLPHRLDRPTSGVLVLAKTSKALSRLTQQFKNRNQQKTYWAIVEQKPTLVNGILVNYLIKDQKKNKSFVVKADKKGAKRAELHYQLIGHSTNYYLIEVDLKTGRHHQIRVQLANIGCIIKGDLKYGAKRSNKDGSICLHARSLTFEHPVKKEEVSIKAPLPKDNLWQSFASLTL